MSHHLCPLCLQPGRLLPDSRTGATVEYYRCDPCKQVWSYRKDAPESPPRPETPIERTP